MCPSFLQVIAAEGEQKASRALREASEVIADTPSALQLRYLQVQSTDNCDRYPLSTLDSADPELHLGGEELHDHIPAPHGDQLSLRQGGAQAAACEHSSRPVRGAGEILN